MGNALAFTSGSTSLNLSQYKINAFAVWSADSTSAIILTEANTLTDVIFKHDYPAGAQNAIANPKWYSFGQGQPLGNIKAPTVTAGTVYLYFI